MSLENLLREDKFPKVIWIYWAQGFQNAPLLVKKVVESWKKCNPEWDVLLLDDKNINDFIKISLKEENWNNMPMAHRADLIRLMLLEKYGGIWSDATVYCMKPLDCWIDEVMQEGFFAFYRPSNYRLISSWFLAAEKDNKIVKTWREAFESYYRDNRFIKHGFVYRRLNKILGKVFNKKLEYTKYWLSPLVVKVLRVNPYFIIHYLFYDVVTKNDDLNDSWKRIRKIDANKLHKLKRYGMMKDIDKKDFLSFVDADVYMYKLDWKHNPDDYKENTLVRQFLYEEWECKCSESDSD